MVRLSRDFWHPLRDARRVGGVDRGWSLRSTSGDPLRPRRGRLWRGLRGSRRLAAQGASRSPSPAQRAGKDRPGPVSAQRANDSSRTPRGSWNGWPVGPDGVSPRYQGLRPWMGERLARWAGRRTIRARKPRPARTPDRPKTSHCRRPWSVVPHKLRSARSRRAWSVELTGCAGRGYSRRRRGRRECGLFWDPASAVLPTPVFSWRSSRPTRWGGRFLSHWTDPPNTHPPPQVVSSPSQPCVSPTPALLISAPPHDTALPAAASPASFPARAARAGGGGRRRGAWWRPG